MSALSGSSYGHFNPHPTVTFSSSLPPDNGGGGPSALDGYFRFNLDGTTFRLMLLSKDRQSLLKIYSYDFILVGMQVTNYHGHLEWDIWQFEWKRLDRHSKKAVAPVVVFGYLRDVLRLGYGSNGGGSGTTENSLRRTVDEGKVELKKTGRKHHAIPRFCDFVTGNSSQLEDLFLDLRRLYYYPGFVLQQCAYVNNLAHFSKIIDNPNVTEEDVLYKDDDTGDNPIMIAAKLRHKDLVSSVLRSSRFLAAEGRNDSVLSELVHARNALNQTLLAMVALQGETNWHLNSKLFRIIVRSLQVLSSRSRSYLSFKRRSRSTACPRLPTRPTS